MQILSLHPRPNLYLTRSPGLQHAHVGLCQGSLSSLHQLDVGDAQGLGRVEGAGFLSDLVEGAHQPEVWGCMRNKHVLRNC